MDKVWNKFRFIWFQQLFWLKNQWLHMKILGFWRIWWAKVYLRRLLGLGGAIWLRIQWLHTSFELVWVWGVTWVNGFEWFFFVHPENCRFLRLFIYLDRWIVLECGFRLNNLINKLQRLFLMWNAFKCWVWSKIVLCLVKWHRTI